MKNFLTFGSCMHVSNAKMNFTIIFNARQVKADRNANSYCILFSGRYVSILWACNEQKTLMDQCLSEK
jgi:hypothetical protein